MKYLIGIDGGGSKTKVNCYDLTGKLISEIVTGPADYHELGIDNEILRLKDALDRLNVDLSDSLIGFGMPAFGENKDSDEAAVSEIKKAFRCIGFHVDNDVTCAWAGATALSPGITVVCGTGSMAVGRDPHGKFARSGGWCPFFSDEGSGYWLGLKALEIYSKQSDSRLPRGPLYEIMREHLNVKDDFEIIGIIDSQYQNSREKTASLQKILLQAAEQGDDAAVSAYEQAVSEVALLAAGVKRQLDFGDGMIDLYYAGGLFNLEEFFLEPFTCEIGKHFKANVHPPKLTQCQGAILLALEFGDGSYGVSKEQIIEKFLSQRI